MNNYLINKKYIQFLTTCKRLLRLNASNKC